MDGAPACPFVAFEDDRETRAPSPDPRHRCYAELVPSPRAAAHQEAYCLSSAFPVCPTFQDWARREAAHARGEGDRPRAALTAQPKATGDLGHEPEPRSARGPRPESGIEAGLAHDPLAEPPILRNPPRDWAAPPPWASGASGSAGSGTPPRSPSGGPPGAPPGAPGFLAGRADESRGLAGSAADRLAAGPGSVGDGDPPAAFDGGASAGPDAELAGLVSGRPVAERASPDYLPPSRSTRRPTVSSTRASSRDREREAEREAIVGPAWEHARRYEAYPTIRSRTGLPAPPRLAVLAGALLIAAAGLFFLPALLGVGGGGGTGTATASPSASQGVPTASLQPTTPPAPTPQVYVIKSGDTLSKVAKGFGLTLEELLAANTATITDPDKIAVGDEIIIPATPPAEFTDPSAEPS